MSDVLVKQQTLLQTVERFLPNFKKIGKNNLTAAKVRSRISVLKENWALCVDGHAALQLFAPVAASKEAKYFEMQLFEKHEELYQEALDYMADCLEELEPTTAAAPLASSTLRTVDLVTNSVSHLPPIKILPFSGKLDEWETFRDRFIALIIDNKELSAFSRMHFLASSLTGSALEAIRSVPVTADNFEIAWKVLLSRYDNKRRLIDTHVSALYSLPNVARESAADFNNLRDKANRAIASLKKLNRSTDEILSDMLVHSVVQKLDPATRKAWKLKGSERADIPSYDDLDQFLAARARAFEELNPPSSAKSTRAAKPTSATASATTPISCPLCKASHFLNKCAQFMKLSPSQRAELVKQYQRCFNCFSIKHAVQSCPSKFSCQKCKKQHHTLLHTDSGSASNMTVMPAAISANSIKEETSAVALTATAQHSQPRVLLATARVCVRSPSGRSRVVRALLDQGSEVTLVSEKLSQILKLKRVRTPISICAVGCVDAGTCKYAAQIEISPINKSEPVLTTIASIMRSLTGYSPPRSVSYNQWDYLADLALADPTLTRAEPIEIIIGSDLYGEIIRDGIRRGAVGQPIAQNTIFGWILSGPTALPHSAQPSTVRYCSHATSSSQAEMRSLDNALRRFWELEEIPRQTVLTPDEQRCEDHFIATHSRSADGRYIVRLPFKDGPPIDIGHSRDIATRCLRGLNRKFKIFPTLHKEYCDFLRDYEELGHMRRASILAKPSQCIYIPHHPVIRDSSSTTRLRVVFNASSLTSNSTSLNDHLLTGQKLQIDLATVIMRWRRFRYVYSADIAKMYRQIHVDTRDVDYQRILWCDSESGSVRDYQLTTVTYGTAAAPFLALRVLRQLTQDEGHSFPLAVTVLRNHIYVDDLLFGADNVQLLRETRTQACELLGKGHFRLRKWSSNSSQLLHDIPTEDHGLACSKTLQGNEMLSILGIRWVPSRDVFQFQVSIPLNSLRTKRSILSIIARLFDPLGWSVPVTISAKIFLQKLWQLRVDWDDILPPNLTSDWVSIEESLKAINDLQINRWDNRGADTIDCELHGFSDASIHAYAASVYLRVQSSSGEVSSTLLISKSKVAPLKPLTVPRLELAAAVLLSRLLEFVIRSLSLSGISSFCWTDSMVVLAWVTQHPSKWKTFVSNRVTEIQSRIPAASWRHVSTHDNPADCASRGIPGSQLASNTLWWHGPAWLCCSRSEWPTPISLPSIECSLEQNETRTMHLSKPRKIWDLSVRFSSWPRLLRVTAYVMRFISRIRTRILSLEEDSQSSSFICASEIRTARTFWLTQIQREVFPLERDALFNNRPLSSRSALLSLNPFVDEFKIIRVGGRLSRAPIPLQKRHPIILASHVGALNRSTRSPARSSRGHTADALNIAPRILAHSRSQHSESSHSSMRRLRSRKGSYPYTTHGRFAFSSSLPSLARISKLRARLCGPDSSPRSVRPRGDISQGVHSRFYMHGYACNPH